MNQRLRAILFYLLDIRAIILGFAVFNFMLIWLEASNASGGGVVAPWYFPWSNFNEPTILLVAALALKVNRTWANCISCVLSGYLLGYFIWLFAIYGDGVRVALHYEWLSIKHQPFIGSWDSQYLFALIIFSSTIFYLTRATLSWKALRHTASNNSFNRSAG